MITPNRKRLFFFNDTAPTEIYTLSLHDALPICVDATVLLPDSDLPTVEPDLDADLLGHLLDADRKSTRLNSSHVEISYAVFCLKKKKKKNRNLTLTKQHKTTIK